MIIIISLLLRILVTKIENSMAINPVHAKTLPKTKLMKKKMRNKTVISTRNMLLNLYLTWERALEINQWPNNTQSFLVLVMQFLCNMIPRGYEVVTVWPLETLNLVNLLQLKPPLFGCLIKNPLKHIAGTVSDQFWRQFRAQIVQVGTAAMRGWVVTF